MLKFLPAPMHRTGLRLAHALRKQWWRLRRPLLNGCRVMVLDDDGQILLVRHSYGSGRWSMPGGGIHRNETPLAAAIRELREETGLVLCEAQHLGADREQRFGADDRVHVVAGRATGELRIDGREVIDARFFAPDGLPCATMRGLPERIPHWVEQYRGYNSES